MLGSDRGKIIEPYWHLGHYQKYSILRVQENCLVRTEGNYVAPPVAKNEKEKTNLQILRAKVILMMTQFW